MLVCCTGGEAGDILNPAVDTPEVRDNLFAVRMQELQNAADAIGYAAVHLLGYHDSGMPDSEDNARPDNFANAPLDEAIERLVRIIRAERPQVIITYADDREVVPAPGPHPGARDLAARVRRRRRSRRSIPTPAPPWTPSKLYYTGFSRRRIEAMHEEFLRRGEESPYAGWFERGFPTHAERLHDVRRRRRLAAPAPRRAARAPHPGGSRGPLDAAPRRRDPRDLPVGGVPARASRGSTTAWPRATSEDDLFAGLRADVLEHRT